MMHIYFHWANCYRYCWQTVYKCGEMKAVRRQCPVVSVDDVRAPSSLSVPFDRRQKDMRTGHLWASYFDHIHTEIYLAYTSFMSCQRQDPATISEFFCLFFPTPSHHSHTHTHTHIYIYICIHTMYIYVCVCVCVCVCVYIYIYI